MKRGTKVAVCHDGKWSRMVEGVVVDTRRGHHIKVSFLNPVSRKLYSFGLGRLDLLGMLRREAVCYT